MARLAGILETCLYVADVPASRTFYEGVLGLDAIIGDERICTFDLGPQQVLILFRRGGTPDPIPVGAGVIPPHDGAGRQHVAFAIGEADHGEWKRRVEACGIAVEGEVEWPGGGRSFYFRDPDGLLIELATPGLWGKSW